VMMGGIDLVTAVATVVSSYVFSTQPAAVTLVQSVNDSLGTPREVTLLFYQVNDLSPAATSTRTATNTVTATPTETSTPTSTAPVTFTLTPTPTPTRTNSPTPTVTWTPTSTPPAVTQRALYAWYAFETTGGAPTNKFSLLGGTYLIEGNISGTCPFDRGTPGDVYWGDFLYFNPSDGSLASEGAVRDRGGIRVQMKPNLYLPPLSGGVATVVLDLGTAGLLGTGQRNGLTGDP
jgi:hypothetical protein